MKREEAKRIMKDFEKVVMFKAAQYKKQQQFCMHLLLEIVAKIICNSSWSNIIRVGDFFNEKPPGNPNEHQNSKWNEKCLQILKSIIVSSLFLLENKKSL